MYFLKLTTRKKFLLLTKKQKRNICGQIHKELDYTGDFTKKKQVSIKTLESTIIMIPFKSHEHAISFRTELLDGMHPDRAACLKLVGRNKKKLPTKDNVIFLKQAN